MDELPRSHHRHARLISLAAEGGIILCMLFHRLVFWMASYLAWASALAAGQSVGLDIPALESSAKAELDATKTPGAAIGIVRDGRLIYANGFGTSNIETGAPVTSETLFRLGSTTKMLTAAAVATFAADGKLDFGDTVGKHIQGLDPAIAALTVNQILSHTSGLKDEAVMNGRHDDSALGQEIRAWKSDWLFTKPGAIFSYANPGYWLAGYVAESVGGKPYADVMEERVFGPVGMASSTLRPTMAMTRALSQGHDKVDNKVVVLRPAPDNEANWPAGSVFSNLIDLSRFVIAMMNDGKVDGKQVLSPKIVQALTTPHSGIPGERAKYGYGLDLEERGGVRMWSHGGSRAGYGSFIAMLPGRQAGVIVLCNQTGESLPKTAAKVLEMLGGPLPEKDDVAESVIPASEFAMYVGSYRNGETTMQIAERDGKLFFRLTAGLMKMDGELRKGEAGRLIVKGADGKTAERMMGVSGADGRIEYLIAGGRAAVRAM
jgi:CubicO group peptidase (beta-lactamase class C family)